MGNTPFEPLWHQATAHAPVRPRISSPMDPHQNPEPAPTASHMKGPPSGGMDGAHGRLGVGLPRPSDVLHQASPSHRDHHPAGSGIHPPGKPTLYRAGSADRRSPHRSRVRHPVQAEGIHDTDRTLGGRPGAELRAPGFGPRSMHSAEPTSPLVVVLDVAAHGRTATRLCTCPPPVGFRGSSRSRRCRSEYVRIAGPSQMAAALPSSPHGRSRAEHCPAGQRLSRGGPA